MLQHDRKFSNEWHIRTIHDEVIMYAVYVFSEEMLLNVSVYIYQCSQAEEMEQRSKIFLESLLECLLYLTA